MQESYYMTTDQYNSEDAANSPNGCHHQGDIEAS